MWRLRVARRFMYKLGNGDNWQSYPKWFFVRMKEIIDYNHWCEKRRAL